MARLLVRGEWFEALLPDAVYEVDYEAHLVSQAAHLYPAFHLVKFKQLLDSEYGRGRPDLALIDRQYRSWWVVEVELGTHDLRQHVQRQVEVFANARYDQDTADYLADTHSQLDRAALREMMLGAPPGVLVLVNQNKPVWASELARWAALVGVVEVFRDDRNNVVLRVNGDHPSSSGGVVSRCRIDPSLPKTLIIESPAALGVEVGAKVVLWFEGGMTEWKRIDARDTVWLRPTKRCPLRRHHRSFDIIKAEDGRLLLQAHPHRRTK